MAEAQAGEADRLCTAAARGEHDAVQRILQSSPNPNPNGTNMFGRTAVQVVKMGCLRVLELLLEYGANPNLPDRVKNLTITHDAAREGHADTLKLLLKYKADADLKDTDGNLPLHLAAREGHLEAVMVLAPFTEHPFPANRGGNTPLDLARGDTARWLQSYKQK